MDETLTTHHGRPALRIQRRLAHPPDKVWRALTEPEQLSQWYPFTVTSMQPRPGGHIHFDDGQGTTMQAHITEFDPPHVFAFSEQPPATMPRESADMIRFELRAQEQGCLLTFTHVFTDRPAAASYATGWDGCLTALQTLLAGEPVRWPGPRPEVHEAYANRFGLGAAQVEDTDRGWRLRLERQLTQPVERVWAHLAGPRADLRPGQAVPGGFTAAPITPQAITTATPPTLLTYQWLAQDRPAGTVRWELSPGTGHGARLVLTQTGPGHLTDQRDQALSAWQERVSALAGALAASAQPT